MPCQRATSTTPPTEAAPKCISGRTSYLRVRLAFHPYPQVIPTVCNPYEFGPPRACSARFTLPMGSSPGFGSTRRDLSPFRTRFRSGSACPWLNLATPNHSLAHSTKGTPSPLARLRPAGSRRFQDLFHSPRRGAFHRSLTVLVHYRSPAVFSLGSWSTPLPTRFFVPGGTHARLAPCATPRRLRGSHPLRPAVPGRSAAVRVQARDQSLPPVTPSYPNEAAPTGSYAPLVWAPPVSLAATPGILSLPRGTEMFQFPRFPPPPNRRAVLRYDPKGVAPFGDLWITSCQHFPRAFRRVAASFLGCRRQGIHRLPFFADSAARVAAPPSPTRASQPHRVPRRRFRVCSLSRSRLSVSRVCSPFRPDPPGAPAPDGPRAVVPRQTPCSPGSLRARGCAVWSLRCPGRHRSPRCQGARET